MYIWWLLKCLVVFFWKAYQTCNWSANEACKYYKKNLILTKLPPVATLVWTLSLGHWYIRVYLQIYNPGLSNPTTFLGLFSPNDYRQSIESPTGFPTFNSTEKVLKFTIYDNILKLRKKRCDIWRNLPLVVLGRLINQSINQMSFVSAYPCAYIFPALPQDSFFPDDESEAPNDHSLALILGDVKQECRDLAPDCLEGRRRSCSWWQVIPDVWCHRMEGARHYFSLCSWLDQQILAGWPKIREGV